jgi:hypothetical protein
VKTRSVSTSSNEGHNREVSGLLLLELVKNPLTFFFYLLSASITLTLQQQQLLSASLCALWWFCCTLYNTM